MYEFSCAAALAMGLRLPGAASALRKKVRWLGLPVSFIVLITLGLAYNGALQPTPRNSCRRCTRTGSTST